MKVQYIQNVMLLLLMSCTKLFLSQFALLDSLKVEGDRNRAEYQSSILSVTN